MATFFNTWTQKPQEWNENKPVFAVRVKPGEGRLTFPAQPGDAPGTTRCWPDSIWFACGQFDRGGWRPVEIGSSADEAKAREYLDAWLEKFPAARGKVQLVACPCLFSSFDSHRVIAES